LRWGNLRGPFDDKAVLNERKPADAEATLVMEMRACRSIQIALALKRFFFACPARGCLDETRFWRRAKETFVEMRVFGQQLNRSANDYVEKEDKLAPK
jgi:hypothetical protein